VAVALFLMFPIFSEHVAIKPGSGCSSVLMFPFFQSMLQLSLVVAVALFPAPMLPHPCHFNPLCSCSFHNTKVSNAMYNVSYLITHLVIILITIINLIATDTIWKFSFCHRRFIWICLAKILII